MAYNSIASLKLVYVNLKLTHYK